MTPPSTPPQAAPPPPVGTYRVQLTPDFGFDQARQLAPYLARLGVSHVYFSPYLQAAPGSTHGYDVVDHSQVNEELGGAAAHASLCNELQRLGLGQVIDLVPNHMSIRSRKNRWWWDVLENGPASRYANFFDVDWDYPDERGRNKVLVPILGDHYGKILEAGEITIVRSGSEFTFHYYEHVLPVAPISLAGPLARAAERCRSEELTFAAETLAALTVPGLADEETRARRHRAKAVIGALLDRLFRTEPEVARAVDRELDEVNQSEDLLHELLEHQNYRISFWRAAGQDIDYRRFFDINELAALRVNDWHVFEATHAKILDWVAEGSIQGLRIDHPDGLRDPLVYFERLRQHAPGVWLVAEKILETDEDLRREWPVDGTTGYDFLNRVMRLFVDRDGEPQLTDLYHDFSGEPRRDVHDILREKKRQVLSELLASDLDRLTELLSRVCSAHRRYRDFTRVELRGVIEELVVAMPVYRTYVSARSGATSEDQRMIGMTVDRAKAARPELDVALFDFVRAVLQAEFEGPDEAEFYARFQQLCAPVTAKGVEDTAFYCYHRLICLNEVGGDPARFGSSVDEYHEQCRRIQHSWPTTMNNTSTHDTKRSEDVRLRIALLSEIPDKWASTVRRWSEMAEQYRQGEVPERAVEYMLYQTLVGAWPLSPERLTTYLTKALREAKQATSWLRSDEVYEQRVLDFARQLIADPAFVGDLEAFVAAILPAAQSHSLSQLLLKLTAPGVPDIYQGNELWDYSLTDPDNRRPVDFDLRRQLLERAQTADAAEVLGDWSSGLPKLWLTHRALGVRRAHPEAFGVAGTYHPLHARGEHSGRVIAFRRGESVIVVAARLTLGLQNDWRDTRIELPAGTWRDALGETVWEAGERELRGLLERFPAALLVKEAPS